MISGGGSTAETWSHDSDDTCKLALASALGDLWPALDGFAGVHIVGLIHDEILLEVPRDLVEEVKAVALASMTSEKLQSLYLGDITLKVECNIAECWGDAH